MPDQTEAKMQAAAMKALRDGGITTPLVAGLVGTKICIKIVQQGDQEGVKYYTSIDSVVTGTCLGMLLVTKSISVMGHGPVVCIAHNRVNGWYMMVRPFKPKSIPDAIESFTVEIKSALTDGDE